MEEDLARYTEDGVLRNILEFRACVHRVKQLSAKVRTGRQGCGEAGRGGGREAVQFGMRWKDACWGARGYLIRGSKTGMRCRSRLAKECREERRHWVQRGSGWVPRTPQRVGAKKGLGHSPKVVKP